MQYHIKNIFFTRMYIHSWQTIWYSTFNRLYFQGFSYFCFEVLGCIPWCRSIALGFDWVRGVSCSPVPCTRIILWHRKRATLKNESKVKKRTTQGFDSHQCCSLLIWSGSKFLIWLCISLSEINHFITVTVQKNQITNNQLDNVWLLDYLFPLQ